MFVGALVAPLASVAPTGNSGPSCFGTCSSNLGAEISEGPLEDGTPRTQLLQPGEVQGVAQTCVWEMSSQWSPSPGSTHPAPCPSPLQPPSLLPCSKLWRLSWASWCSCSMPGGRPAARKTFTGCCHGSLAGAAFLLSRSRLEVAAGRRERGQRQVGGGLPAGAAVG